MSTPTAAPSIRDLMLAYFAARGRPVPTPETGSKVLEEANELVEALAGTDHEHTLHELGDVVIAAAAVAEALGTTIEECIRLKTILDTGRDGTPTLVAD